MKSNGYASIVVAAVLVAGLAWAGAGRADADVVTLVPDKDNTLIEYPGGPFSSGAGRSFYVGQAFTTRPVGQRLKRGLLHFDVAGVVPPGSTIHSVELQLAMQKRAPFEQTDRLITLHRVTKDWGEGTSFSTGGGGDTASEGDATWLHTFSPGSFWDNPGGDYDPTVTQSLVVGINNGQYTWPTGPQMVADVQSWLDNPESNFGWIVIGDESVIRTTRRFGTRESLSEGLRPQLTINFTAPPEEACKAGTVDLANGAAQNVLSINGSAGDGSRVVRVAVGEPISIDMVAPVSGPSPAPFALYLVLGTPSAADLTPLPKNIGTLCFGIPLTGGSVYRTWNNIGRFNKLGMPDLPSTPAPSNVVTLPSGSTVAATASLQGLIPDDGSAADVPASITNLVTLEILETP